MHLNTTAHHPQQFIISNKEGGKDIPEFIAQNTYLLQDRLQRATK